MSEDSFTITVKIAARNIRLNIPRAEEEKYRAAARRLNNLIAYYRKQYAYVEEDHELILIMAAFHLGVDFFGEQQRRDLLPLLEKIANWDKTIDEHLNSSK